MGTMTSEAPKMRRAKEPARPHGGREYELVRGGCGGLCWRARDGVEVRVAAAEREPDLVREDRRSGVSPGVRAFFAGVLAR